MSEMTLNEARALAASQGIKLSPTDNDQIARLIDGERARLVSSATTTGGQLGKLVSAFNSYYPSFLRALVGLSEVLYTTSQTVIVSFGVPLVLVLLLIVEHSRVQHGIMLFEGSAALASFAAWSLVILNLVLEFTVHHIEHKAGYQAKTEHRDSLRLRWLSLKYWLGFDRNWKAEMLSPAQRYKKLLKLVTFTILALALAGSMRHTISQQPGAWYQALWAIAAQSTLSEMSTWAGGLLFAFAAVSGAQGLTAYLAVRVTEIVASMEANQQTIERDPAESAGVQYLMAMIATKQEAKLARLQKKAIHEEGDTQPIEQPYQEAITPFLATNGNGKHA